jgi:YVTN family beta-propeller protein
MIAFASALVLALSAGQGTAPPPVAAAAPPPGVLIVLNKAAATADFFDPGTGERLRSLATGTGPHEGAVTPDGRLAVVANYGAKEPGGTLAIYDLAEGVALEPLDLGGPARPHGLAFAGGLLLVTAETRGALLGVDLERRAVVKTVATEQAASHMVAATPDGKRAFVANIGSGSITAVDLDTWQVIKSVPTGAEAEGIDVSPDGKEVWVTNRAADTVTVLDAATLETRATLECPGFPIRVKLSPDGALALVSAPKAGEVAVFDARTRALKARVPLRFERAAGAEQGFFGGTLGESAQPIGILIPPAGREAYIACAAADRVAVLDLTTLALARSFATGREPDGLAWYATPG